MAPASDQLSFYDALDRKRYLPLQIEVTACAHEPKVRRGMCLGCYQRARYAAMPPARCHPKRKEHAGGLCRLCYDRGGRAKPALCHPQRRRVALGLCAECYAARPERKARDAKMRRVRKYGLTEAAYDALLAAQQGKCAICATNAVSAIDHDHATGAVRGLLCHDCNAALGLMRDEPERLDAAAEYLRRSRVREAS